VGKVLGLVRDVSLAYFFGTNRVADAFRVSLLAALVPTHFFMGDVLSGAFVPLYIRYRLTNGGKAARLLSVTGAYLLIVSLVLAIGIWIGGGWLLRLVAPGLAGETREIAARMVRWMGLGVPFYCLAGLLGLYGICVNRFRPIALRPAFQNGGLLLVIPLAARLKDPGWIGLGFAAAFVVYLGYVWWELGAARPSLSSLRDMAYRERGELRALYDTATPLLSIMVLGQLLTIVDRAAASFVGVGAIASLEYARVFVETPHVLVGSAIATMALSRYSGLDGRLVSARAVSLTLALLTSALGGMVVLAAAAPELVTVVYQRGRFDAAAVASVTFAVRGLALGGAFMTASYVLNRVLSAQLRNRESVAPMVICVLVAVVANVVLAPRLGILGVGLAMTAAYVVMFVLLAGRLDMWPSLLERAPAWLTGGTLAVSALILLQRMDSSIIVRLGVICAGCTLAWFGGVALFGAGRADLAVLRDQLGRLLGSWSSQDAIPPS
jgi:putative peptidoglycan lipid II flippase